MDKHHSCINTRAIIEYFEAQSPEAVPTLLAGLGPEIAALPAPREILLEANNWVSSEIVIQMFRNARRITGREDIAFDIGFQSAARKKLGYVQRLFPGWGGPTGHGGRGPGVHAKALQCCPIKWQRSSTRPEGGRHRAPWGHPPPQLPNPV